MLSFAGMNTLELVSKVLPGSDIVAFERPKVLGDFKSEIEYTGTPIYDYLESEEDGDPVVLAFNNFVIDENHIVTPRYRCKGMYLTILGDLIVNGTLSMTARGAKAEGKYVGIDPTKQLVYFQDENKYPENFTVIHPTGGGPNKAGENGACGGGGSGGRGLTGGGGAGATGTSFSGGPGGGGGGNDSRGEAGSPNGGPGGRGIAYSAGNSNARAGGGAGNPGGLGGVKLGNNVASLKGADGTGGLMILFVKGNIIIGSKGTIESNGSAGASVPVYGQSGAGGGSGAGAIHIFHWGTFEGSERVKAVGGAKGTGGNSSYTSYPGGNGTINIVKMG